MCAAKSLESLLLFVSFSFLHCLRFFFMTNTYSVWESGRERKSLFSSIDTRYHSVQNRNSMMMLSGAVQCKCKYMCKCMRLSSLLILSLKDSECLLHYLLNDIDAPAAVGWCFSLSFVWASKVWNIFLLNILIVVAVVKNYNQYWQLNGPLENVLNNKWIQLMARN